MTESLSDWLLEQVELDEAVTKEQGETHTVGCTARLPYEWEHQCRCGFASRVLAECEAKRRIVEDCLKILAVDGWEYDDTPDLAARTLRRLALPYADREGYRPEWRP